MTAATPTGETIRTRVDITTMVSITAATVVVDHTTIGNSQAPVSPELSEASSALSRGRTAAGTPAVDTIGASEVLMDQRMDITVDSNIDDSNMICQWTTLTLGEDT